MSSKPLPNPQSIARALIQYAGDNPERAGLQETPARAARAWDHLFGGYQLDEKKILSRQFEDESGGAVILRDVEFFSTCEHHLLPFFGRAHLAYLADTGKVVGLSKMARLVHCFARRLQVQERLTKQIGDALSESMDVSAAVIVEAQHFCMMARGVQQTSARMETTFTRGPSGSWLLEQLRRSR